MPRDQYSEYRSQRHHGTRDYDPEFDARNYARERLPDPREKVHATRDAGEANMAKAKDYVEPQPVGYSKEKSSSGKHKKSKHKKKHSRDKEEKKKKVKAKLVEYEDVSTNSDTYSSQSSPVRSRVAVSPEAERRPRRPSPGTAIKAYQKHIIERSHSNSPVGYDVRDKVSPVPTATYKGSKPGKSNSSRKSSQYNEYVQQPSQSHGHPGVGSASGSGSLRANPNSNRSPSPGPKAYRGIDAPKAYADPPRAYRTRSPEESPSPVKRQRYASSRSPSPSYRPSRRRSPTSPHRFVNYLTLHFKQRII